MRKPTPEQRAVITKHFVFVTSTRVAVSYSDFLAPRSLEHVPGRTHGATSMAWFLEAHEIYWDEQIRAYVLSRAILPEVLVQIIDACEVAGYFE